MKKTLILSILAALFVLPANAVEIKEGSLYCVNSKKIVEYYDLVERGKEDFAKRLVDKADCFVKRKTEDTVLKSENKKYVELELISGFTIWTKKENIVR